MQPACIECKPCYCSKRAKEWVEQINFSQKEEVKAADQKELHTLAGSQIFIFILDGWNGHIAWRYKS